MAANRTSTQKSNVAETAKAGWLAHRWEVGVMLVGLLAMNAIFISPAFRGVRVHPPTAGLFGDFVGGYVGTAFGLLSVLMLMKTLRSQREGALREHFESKYFTLLQLHRDNVTELAVEGSSGRKVFVSMMLELRETLARVRAVAARLGVNLSALEILHIGYYCFFFGTGPNSSRVLRSSLSEFDSALIDAIERDLNDWTTKLVVEHDKELGYAPFEGHQSRLGHYYRHLYQTVKFIDQQPIAIEKYDYVKTVRAQLSTHEQALLLVNSLTPLGAAWWKNSFITRYRMVQNLPENFFEPNVELDVSSLFPHGYFEWQDA